MVMAMAMAEDHQLAAADASGIAAGQPGGAQKGVPAEIFVKRPSGAARGGVPAFLGARHDRGGYCLAHPKVQLSEPVFAEDAKGDANPVKYRPVRKICPQCGLHPPTRTLSKIRTLPFQEKGKEHRPNSREEQTAKAVPRKKSVEGAPREEDTGLAKPRDGGKEKHPKRDGSTSNVEKERGGDKNAAKVNDDSKVKYTRRGSTSNADREKEREKEVSAKDDGKEKNREREGSSSNVEKEKERDKDITKVKDEGKDKHSKREKISNADREKRKGREVDKVKDEVRERHLRRENTLNIDREQGRENDATKPKDDGKEKKPKQNGSNGDDEKGRDKDAAEFNDRGRVKHLNGVSMSKVEKERGREKDMDMTEDDGRERKVKTDGSTSNIGRERAREEDEAKTQDDEEKIARRDFNENINVGSRAGRQHSLRQSHSMEPSPVEEEGGANHVEKKTNDNQHSLQRGHSNNNNINSRAGHQRSLQHGRSKSIDLCIGRQYSLQHDRSKRHDSGKEFVHREEKGEFNHRKKKKEDIGSLADRHHFLQHGHSKNQHLKELSPVDEEEGSYHKKQPDGNMYIPKIPTYKVTVTRLGGQPGKTITEERDTDNESGPAAGVSGIPMDRKGIRKDKDTRETNAKEKELLFCNQHRKKSIEVKGQRMMQRQGSSSRHSKLKKVASDINGVPEVIRMRDSRDCRGKMDDTEPRERRSSINKDDRKISHKSTGDVRLGKVGFTKTPQDHHSKLRGPSIRKDVRKGMENAAEQSKSTDPNNSDTKQHHAKNKNDGYKKKGSRTNHAMKLRSSRGRSKTRNREPYRSLSAERARKRDQIGKKNDRHYQRSKTLDVPRRGRACSSEHHHSNLSIYRQEFYKEVAHLEIDSNELLRE